MKLLDRFMTLKKDSEMSTIDCGMLKSISWVKDLKMAESTLKGVSTIRDLLSHLESTLYVLSFAAFS